MTTRPPHQDHDHRPAPRRRWLRPRVLVPAGAVGAGLLTVGLVLFEPWTLFVDERVEEAAPVSSAAQPSTDEVAAPGTTAAPAPDTTETPETATTATPKTASAKADAPVRTTKPPAPAGPVTLLKGKFISHEHETSGSATVLKLADGSRVLRIKGLDTSNGPDLRVWLADAPVRNGRAGWFVFDDGAHLELGPLKGNIGDQNYAVPAGADLESLRSVSIWCARFRVSFGAAALT